MVINGTAQSRILDIAARAARGFGLNLCALHLGALISPVTDAKIPETMAAATRPRPCWRWRPTCAASGSPFKSPPDGDAIRSLILVLR